MVPDIPEPKLAVLLPDDQTLPLRMYPGEPSSSKPNTAATSAVTSTGDA